MLTRTLRQHRAAEWEALLDKAWLGYEEILEPEILTDKIDRELFSLKLRKAAFCAFERFLSAVSKLPSFCVPFSLDHFEKRHTFVSHVLRLPPGRKQTAALERLHERLKRTVSNRSYTWDAALVELTGKDMTADWQDVMSVFDFEDDGKEYCSVFGGVLILLEHSVNDMAEMVSIHGESDDLPGEPDEYLPYDTVSSIELMESAMEDGLDYTGIGIEGRRFSESMRKEIHAAIREVLGNPFRPCHLSTSAASFHGGIINILATEIAESGKLTKIPILADALEDANCPQRMVDHLRQHEQHAIGCWVLDTILGRHSCC